MRSRPRRFLWNIYKTLTPAVTYLQLVIHSCYKRNTIMVLDAIIDILSYVYIRSESHGWEKCIQDLEISCRNVTNDISGGRHLSSIELKGNEIVCVVKRSSNWGYPFPQCIGYGGQSGGCKQWAYTSWRRGSEISDWRSLQPCTSWWGAWLAPPSSVWNWYLQKLVIPSSPESL